MKKIMFATVAVLGLTLSAQAQVLIGVGQPDRGYERYGERLVERLGDRVPAQTVNYEGSNDISLAVCSDEVAVGIMQIDAHYTRQMEGGCKMRVVGVYGKEYAYLLTPPNSDINELHGFTAQTRILVDTVGSGTDLFWNTVVSIENGPDGNKSTWSKAKPVNDPIFLAGAMSESKEIDAVLMVTVPDSSELKELITAGWNLVDFSDKDIDDELFNGSSLYPREKAAITGTGNWLTGEVTSASYVVRSFIMVSEKTSTDKALFTAIARAAKEVSASR